MEGDVWKLCSDYGLFIESNVINDATRLVVQDNRQQIIAGLTGSVATLVCEYA